MQAVQSSEAKDPPSLFKPLCHPKVEETRKKVNGLYLQHWPFPDAKARRRFVNADFAGMAALLIPKSLDDRLSHAASLVSITFLIDDELEGMSRKDGEEYNRIVMEMCIGDKKPDRNVPVQWLMYDTFEEMRRYDRKLADETMEALFVFLRAMVAQERLADKGIGDYLRYREGDIGQAFLAALNRYGMDLHLSSAELKSCELLEKNVAHHESVVNDIFSYEKELHTSKTAHKEGGRLSSSVPIFALETGISIDGAKRVLLILAREMEIQHNKLVKKLLESSENYSEDFAAYLDSFAWNMSGNEEWCRQTLRYRIIG